MDSPLTLQLVGGIRRLDGNLKLCEFSDTNSEPVCVALAIRSVNKPCPDLVMLTAAGLAHRFGYLIPNWFVLGIGERGTSHWKGFSPDKQSHNNNNNRAAPPSSASGLSDNNCLYPAVSCSLLLRKAVETRIY